MIRKMFLHLLIHPLIFPPIHPSIHPSIQLTFFWIPMYVFSLNQKWLLEQWWPSGKSWHSGGDIHKQIVHDIVVHIHKVSCEEKTLFFWFLTFSSVSVLVWITIKIECVFLYLVVSASPGQVIKSTRARMSSALFNVLSPVQVLKDSESCVPGTRYHEGKMSKRWRGTDCGAEKWGVCREPGEEEKWVWFC